MTEWKAKLINHIKNTTGRNDMDGYVSVRDIVKQFPEVSYYWFIGSRSNGKTYGALDYALEEYFKDGSEIAYIRRWDEDIRGKRGQQVFANIVRNGRLKELSKGKWTGIRYYSGQWWLIREKGENIIQDVKPFAYAFSLNSMEHDKSTGYPNVRNIIFDEFLTRGFGLADEFVIWTNVLSTIIRDQSRRDVRVFMLANTINFDSIYFKEYGIENIRKMKVGEIDYYEYGQSAMNLLVCYTLPRKIKEEDNRFFAFNNPEIQMINNGSWEFSLYPHAPCSIRKTDASFSYFICYGEDILQADIIPGEDGFFTYIHMKTTPLRDPEHDLIYTTTISHRHNIRLNILKPTDKLGTRILRFYKEGKVFYQDNTVGEIMNNYLKWCKTNGV